MAESKNTTAGESKTATDGAAANSDAAKTGESAASASKESGKDSGTDSGGAEAASDPSVGYSRGENQKPITRAYKNNWDNIFGKKKRDAR